MHYLETISIEGLYGFGLQSACLTLCVVSIWAPGSPFNVGSSVSFVPATDDSLVGKTNASGNLGDAVDHENLLSFVSVALLMSGIIAARFGESVYWSMFPCTHFLQLDSTARHGYN